MRKMLAALSAIPIVLAMATAPAQAAPAFDPAHPPQRYSAAEEKAHTVKGVMAPKGKIVNGRGYNPNARLLTGPYYFYAGAWQVLSAGQSANTYSVNLHIENPYLDTTNDSHTLAEAAVQSLDQMQTVELGWTHDNTVCAGGTSPCLFAGSWKNGAFLGYNTGFVDYAAEPRNLGATLTTGTPKRFYWTYSGGVWWAAYDNLWVGYYPGTIWSNAPNAVTFDKGGVFNGFYEVATKATGDNTPCTDMGNGKLGTDASGLAARSGTNAISGTLPGAIANSFGGYSFGGGVYDHNTLSTQTTRAGGPGYNAAGTGVGTAGSC